MALKNTRSGWGLPARLLHWSMAIVILFLLAVGFYMAEVLTATDSETLTERFMLTQTHKSWGFVAFALALVRVVWRLVNPTPALPEAMSPTEHLLAHGGHYALYVCLFAMPVSGWLMASASPLQDAYGVKNMVFGLFELPDPFQPGGEEIETWLKRVHFYTGLALTLLILGHAAAAMKHHFVNKDTVLRRMIRG